VGWIEDLEDKRFEVVLRNESSKRLLATVNPDYFGGRIYIADGDSVQIVQQGNYFVGLRVGPRPMKEVWLAPGATYTYRIGLDGLVGADGGATTVAISGGARIFCLTEDCWDGGDGKAYEPAVIVSEVPLDYDPKTSEQGGTGQPATRPESDSEGGDKPQPESEGRSR